MRVEYARRVGHRGAGVQRHGYAESLRNLTTASPPREDISWKKWRRQQRKADA